MIRFTGINHLAMATGDMEATIRFWRDLLGMRLVAGIGHPGYRHYFLEISETDMIAFFEWPNVKPLEPKDHGVPVEVPFAFDHISFGVAERADLWELKAKLEAAGFWASEIIDHGFILSLYSFDPNNIAIEFSWNQPGMDLRKQPRLVDKNPPQVRLEGSEPQPGHWPAPVPIAREDMKIYPGEGREILGRS
ncbi:VOC family protein [Fundidesulfovibrio putealis]|uniref:VOC family protein n=1 Tax=Fundidesulfovibrio putealis TaxID=270496 RepID=UPI000420B7C3|nr:VOC family protein [Fundidesulfovibrio putealis]